MADAVVEVVVVVTVVVTVQFVGYRRSAKGC